MDGWILGDIQYWFLIRLDFCLSASWHTGICNIPQVNAYRSVKSLFSSLSFQNVFKACSFCIHSWTFSLLCNVLQKSSHDTKCCLTHLAVVIFSLVPLSVSASDLQVQGEERRRDGWEKALGELCVSAWVNMCVCFFPSHFLSILLYVFKAYLPEY